MRTSVTANTSLPGALDAKYREARASHALPGYSELLQAAVVSTLATVIDPATIPSGYAHTRTSAAQRAAMTTDVVAKRAAATAKRKRKRRRFAVKLRRLVLARLASP